MPLNDQHSSLSRVGIGVHLAANPDFPLATVSADGKRIMRMVQKFVNQYEGAVNKMLVDDKGTLIICVLGLPPKPHADDPVRAVGLALDLIQGMKKLRSSKYDGVGADADGHVARRASHSMPPEQLAEKALAQVAVRASTDRDGAPSGAPDASLPPSPILLPSDATKVTEAAEATEPAPPTRTASVLEALGALSPRALLGYGASNADASSAGGNGDGANGGTEEAPLEPLGVYRDSTQARREELNVPAAPPASEEDGSSGSWSCSIGIATGQAFCGVVGSKSRHEYTVMGDCVNLAARLMAHAGKEKLGVLADVVTYRKSDAKKLDTTRLTETTRVERRVEYVSPPPQIPCISHRPPSFSHLPPPPCAGTRRSMR